MNMGSEFESYTAWLVEEVWSFAEVRAREAESYPEDLKILQSSRTLRSLATNLGKLPADHSKIQQLWYLWFGPQQLHSGKTRGLDLIRIVADELEQYGYDRADEGDPELFLNAIIFELGLLPDRVFVESK